MKLIIRIILIGVITYFVSPFAFWWTGMAAAFAICFIIPSRGLIAFISGFLGSGLVWLGQAWSIDVMNESKFSSTIVELFPLSDPFLLIIATGLIGSITGGFAAVSGTFFRKIFLKTKKRGGYN